MKILAFLSLSCCALRLEASPDLPLSHPPLLSLQNFVGQLRCPYAYDWLTKGPKQAALDLGVEKGNFPMKTSTMQNNLVQRRMQDQQAESVKGSCDYTNPFSGDSSCFEMRGDEWTLDLMQDRCITNSNGILTPSAPCTLSGELAGFCFVSSGSMMEATPFVLASNGPMGSCAGAENACRTFLQGEWQPGQDCTDTAEVVEEVTCEIAPGPIGAAHQAAYSKGYFSDCPGTPAEGSPYMWPTRWTAHVEAESMPFGTDEVVYHSRSVVWYRLDKNWKRQDTYYQRGVQRAVGQGPCPEEQIVDRNGPVLSCRRDSDSRTTMIHRGSKMFFISWANGTALEDDSVENISSCAWLDLQVVGNVRPDWFMDARGDQTDTQYLGDQHVYHNGVPRLVKQWRKTDFADQYFTMSMLANPVPASDDNTTEPVHWPLILNVPGEGFGDDFLQRYSNHRLLTEQDEDQFLLDQILEAAGGSCPQIQSSGDVGPPVGQTVHVPSNLEIDPNAWFSNVFTFSPVWEPPVEATLPETTPSDSSKAITEVGSIIVESCWNTTVQAVDLSVTFLDIADTNEMPWLALGYRDDEECLMTPRSGGDTDIILVIGDPQNNFLPGTFYGSLSPSTKSMDQGAISSIYTTLVELSDSSGYSSVELKVGQTDVSETEGLAAASLKIPEGSVQLHFQQSMSEVPESLNLMYAIGSSPRLGYHSTRSCFEVTDFPVCKEVARGNTGDDIPPEKPISDEDADEDYSHSGSSRFLGEFLLFIPLLFIPILSDMLI